MAAIANRTQSCIGDFIAAADIEFFKDVASFSQPSQTHIYSHRDKQTGSMNKQIDRYIQHCFILLTCDVITTIESQDTQ